MVYSNKFVVAVKHNGKILRDDNGIVRLPFGADYSLFLKNKNSIKALVDVEIDGQDVLDSNSIIVGPNASTTLHGFMHGRTIKNKFRFIKKTKQISKYRGDRPDDGLIRVEFRFEQQFTVSPYVTPVLYEPGNKLWPGTGGTQYDVTYTTCNSSNEVTDGITVPGAETNQEFVVGRIGALESSSYVIILQLKGKTSKGNVVKKPITTKTRLTCPTCGKRSKSYAKFCSRCGTYIRN